VHVQVAAEATAVLPAIPPGRRDGHGRQACPSARHAHTVKLRGQHIKRLAAARGCKLRLLRLLMWLLLWLLLWLLCLLG